MLFIWLPISVFNLATLQLLHVFTLPHWADPVREAWKSLWRKRYFTRSSNAIEIFSEDLVLFLFFRAVLISVLIMMIYALYYPSVFSLSKTILSYLQAQPSSWWISPVLAASMWLAYPVVRRRPVQLHLHTGQDPPACFTKGDMYVRSESGARSDAQAQHAERKKRSDVHAPTLAVALAAASIFTVLITVRPTCDIYMPIHIYASCSQHACLLFSLLSAAGLTTIYQFLDCFHYSPTTYISSSFLPMHACLSMRLLVIYSPVISYPADVHHASSTLHCNMHAISRLYWPRTSRLIRPAHHVCTIIDCSLAAA